MITIANNLEIGISVLIKSVLFAMVLGSLVGAISLVVGSVKH
jgi:hypothetical protein